MSHKRRTDAEWIRIIQDCKSSSYPDSEWCRMNNITPSTFYRKLSILREKKACVDDLTKPVICDDQAVVEVNLHKEQPISLNTPTVTNEVALRLNVGGITVEILNSAAKATIENTLQSLRVLC